MPFRRGPGQAGIVTQEDIDWALSNQLDIPYVRLSEKIIDRSATALVPADLARRFNLIPIIRTGDELHIALADPSTGPPWKRWKSHRLPGHRFHAHNPRTA
jgi:hypothetical protein